MVHVTAECWPYARSGGLGEAVSTLAAHQARGGQAVSIVLPAYRSVREAGYALEPMTRHFNVRIGSRDERVRLLRLAGRASGPHVYFVEHPDFTERDGLYGENGDEYADNPRRFALFGIAALAAMPRIGPSARVLHLHDWHAALSVAYLRTAFGASDYHRRLAVVLSVHNAGYQGHCARETLPALGLPESLYDWRLFEWYGRVNLLKGGLALADAVVTVSPTHAKELRTEQGGFGLHGAFDALGDRLHGIVNGIDQRTWCPAVDPYLPAPYTSMELAGKRRCKAELQRAFGLPERGDVAVVAMCARLTAQKGLDLLLSSELLGRRDIQFLFLGEGEARYARALKARASLAPEQVAVRFDFADPLEHLLIAGADLLLAPSVYEPCGLTQMRAQRYGTVPVAHRVGGLADTIEDGVTGFLFTSFTRQALERTMARSLECFRDAPAWRSIMRAAMARDFGWERSALEYLSLYRRAIARVSGIAVARALG